MPNNYEKGSNSAMEGGEMTLNRWGSKYNVDHSDAGKAKRTVDGILFDSQKEARRYKELTLLQKAGQIEWFIRQPQFDLPGNIKYRADFLIVLHDGSIIIEDVKGNRTKEYIIKKKQVEALYPIEIVEV